MAMDRRCFLNALTAGRADGLPTRAAAAPEATALPSIVLALADDLRGNMAFWGNSHWMGAGRHPRPHPRHGRWSWRAGIDPSFPS